MMHMVAETKSSIREELSRRRNAMPQEEAESKSSAIIRNLAKLAEYNKAKAVLFYAAKGSEVQTAELIKEALKQGKKVLLPVTNIHDKELEISEIKKYPEDLKKSTFGIMEPKKKTAVAEETIDIVVVPGIAFDKSGHRIGYGLGYYDKLLRRLRNKNSRVKAIALAYDLQLTEGIKAKEHDQKMDMIITEKGNARCTS